MYYFVVKKYHLKYKKFKDIKKRPYLILFNHQTGFDQCFLSYLFPKHIYIIASEDIFSIGFIARVVNWCVKPIAFKKSTNDARAVKECLTIVKEGGSIALAPEGNRTFNGVTVNIKPSIAKFAKKLGLPIAFVKIEGGYGVKPRFADDIRKGSVHIGVSKVLEKEEYDKLTNEELAETITKELYVNEAYREDAVKSKHLAEHIERAIYVCPHCGLSEFKSKGNELECMNCHYKVTYNGHNEFDQPSEFKNINEWYKYQENFIHNLKLEDLPDDYIYVDDIKLFNVILYKKKQLISDKAKVYLYKDALVIKYQEKKEEKEFRYAYDDIDTLTVLGKNKINFYYEDKLFQFKGDESMNALKFAHFYFHYKNIKENNLSDNEYLGI